MTRNALEQYQVFFYMAAILAGLCAGALAPGAGPVLEALLWPALAVLLYAAFTQVPLISLPGAFRDGRFMAALLIGNFAVLPVLAFALLPLAPADPAVRLGVLLVLLVPCTDWFVSFAHQARGDTGRAIAATPVLLLGQIVLLPLYLTLAPGGAAAGVLDAGHMAMVFLIVIATPLLLALLTEIWAARRPARAARIAHLGWAPVPLLALVVFLIAASQVGAVMGALPLLGAVLPVFALFLTGAGAAGVLLARLFRLRPAAGRTLLFSFSTRNSFVVLPLALALPAGMEAAAIVIVFQSLVELFGMLILLWLTPRMLIPD